MAMTTRDNLTNQFTGQGQLIHAAFDAAFNGIIIIDHQQPNDPIIYCNKAFEQLTGYDRGDVLGKNCRFLQGDQRLQEGRFEIQEALLNNSHCVVELLNYRKDGSEFWNEIYISPIKNEWGVTTHYVGIQNDISDRKLNEIKLKSEAGQFKNLQQQKNDFISAASHELKTPVTSLKASLQLLNKVDDAQHTTKVSALITQANKSIGKVANLIEELLVSDQLLEGSLELRKTKFALGKLISACCSGTRLEGKYKIVLHGDEDLEVFADFERMDQVVLNMVNNAVKYAAGSKTINIHISSTAQVAKVTVSDRGEGIPAERLPFLFDRFYKGQTDDVQTSGLGLGLYISAGIVKRHGGDIGVESELGKGSSFWFTLPLK
ncbi:sensor histidine kinase [Mucilaginibacter corticis]|nr:HAMP domain-containing sensor histidine kinase [Mucilaginibacter corticis]